MKKPKKQRSEPYWDYQEIITYVCDKYKLDQNDFWDYLTDGYYDIHNGCYIYLNVSTKAEDSSSYKDLSSKCKKIADALYKEFGEDQMYVYIDW